MINTIGRFSERADSYDRFRWDFSPEAIQTVLEECGLSNNATVADIGSGTGMLTRHFAGRVRAVIAVEPSAEMRTIAARHLPDSVRSVDGVADATTLPDNSVDMIVVGRALHWFPEDSTKVEFARILKPGGWLAVFSVPCTNQALVDDLTRIRTTDNGWDVGTEKIRMNRAPLSFYFGRERARSLSFPASSTETWDEFLGRVCSFSGAPKSDHPLRPRLERALREVFDRYETGGAIRTPISTEVSFGRML